MSRQYKEGTCIDYILTHISIDLWGTEAYDGWWWCYTWRWSDLAVARWSRHSVCGVTTHCYHTGCGLLMLLSATFSNCPWQTLIAARVPKLSFGRAYLCESHTRSFPPIGVRLRWCSCLTSDVIFLYFRLFFYVHLGLWSPFLVSALFCDVLVHINSKCLHLVNPAAFSSLNGSGSTNDSAICFANGLSIKGCTFPIQCWQLGESHSNQGHKWQPV